MNSLDDIVGRGSKSVLVCSLWLTEDTHPERGRPTLPRTAAGSGGTPEAAAAAEAPPPPPFLAPGEGSLYTSVFSSLQQDTQA